ncbi:hypothetical protein [Anaplasma marginale]|uniref:hypothetical protein n=1 Tax=Anaplasma marginale TaxID=770 RepID=UPI0002F656A3|nr:hypothetical protein [Anaplasma marginale]
MSCAGGWNMWMHKSAPPQWECRCEIAEQLPQAIQARISRAEERIPHTFLERGFYNTTPTHE